MPIKSLKISGRSTQDGTPSPDNPSEIHSVADDGTVTIKQSGKNKLQNLNGTKTINGITFTLNDDKSITINGIATDNITYRFGNNNTKESIKIDPNKHYSLSTTTNMPYKSIMRLEDRVNTNILEDISTGDNKILNINGSKFTSEEVDVFIFIYKDSNINNVTLYPKLEEGTQSTSYEPYFSKDSIIQTEPLRSLYNIVKDTLEVDGIHRRVGNKVFDGNDNEGWRMSKLETKYAFWKNITEIPNALNGVHIKLSNYFKYERKGWKDASNQCICENSINDLTVPKMLIFRMDNLKTLNEWKQWLKNNNITVQYELAEEVIEPLDEEQQKVIDSITTHKGTTYFTNSDNAEMEIEYYKDLETLFNNITEEVADNG